MTGCGTAVGISAAMQALTTLMIVFGPLIMITQANLWLTGSVYGTKWEDVRVLLLWVGILLPHSFVLARHLNVQELGDELAAGVEIITRELVRTVFGMECQISSCPIFGTPLCIPYGKGRKLGFPKRALEG